MASPLRTGKQVVDLSAPVRMSRIRRDPPPIAKPISDHDRRERDKRFAIIGIVAIAAALFVILLAVGSVLGWSPSQYTLRF